jgi:N-acetyl-alpha-D-muramate 1-phosphate uridylyltransferase
MKAMILAAGRGERMRPLTDHLPKALLPVGGRPLILRLAQALAEAGIHDLVVNLAHLGEQIADALGDGGSLGARITYSREAQALETAGGIANALPLLGTAPFVAVNADVCTDYDFSGLVTTARQLPQLGVLAHLVLVPNPPHHPAGDFGLSGGRVTADGAMRLTFSGIGAYQPALFAGITRGSRARLADLLYAAISQRQVSGELYPGYWQDVGTPERLAQADRRAAAG